MIGWWIQLACSGWDWGSDVKWRGEFSLWTLRFIFGQFLCWEALISERYLGAFQLSRFILLCWQLFGSVFVLWHIFTPYSLVCFSLDISFFPPQFRPCFLIRNNNSWRQISYFKCIWLFFNHFRWSENLDDPVTTRSQASSWQLDSSPGLENFQPAAQSFRNSESKNYVTHSTLMRNWVLQSYTAWQRC